MNRKRNVDALTAQVRTRRSVKGAAPETSKATQRPGTQRPGSMPLFAAQALAVAALFVPSIAYGQATPTVSPVAPPLVEKDLLRATPGGLTAEQVGKRAAETSYGVKASEESLRAAAGRVDAAWANFLPRLTAKASYTRLSSFTPPSLGSGSLVGTPSPPGTVNPPVLVAANFSFPIILNNYLLEAQIVVPISDYFLRINEGYTASTQAQEAARQDVATARAKALTEGKSAFYNWLRARGAVVVAEQAREDVKTHLVDVKHQFDAGNVSKADVLRVESSVAASDVQVERTKNLAELLERQVRIALHDGDGSDSKPLSPGEALEGTSAYIPGTLSASREEAWSKRPELKSLSANVTALRKQSNVIRASNYPQVAAFGTATYANPNQRRVPQSNEWFPTWAAGVQATWSPNDLVATKGNASDIDGKIAAIEAQMQQAKEGIDLEVTQAHQGVRESAVALDATKRQLTTAEEAYRVARELFNAGRATPTLLTDAETELTKARLDALNAQVDARIAKVRLDHAMGRDAD